MREEKSVDLLYNISIDSVKYTVFKDYFCAESNDFIPQEKRRMKKKKKKKMKKKFFMRVFSVDGLHFKIDLSNIQQ